MATANILDPNFYGVTTAILTVAGSATDFGTLPILSYTLTKLPGNVIMIRVISTTAGTQANPATNNFSFPAMIPVGWRGSVDHLIGQALILDNGSLEMTNSLGAQIDVGNGNLIWGGTIAATPGQVKQLYPISGQVFFYSL